MQRDKKQYKIPLDYIVLSARICGCIFISAFFILIPTNVFSQKRCNNPPVLALGAISGTTCFLTPVTIDNNTFGGSATEVTLSSDGNGSIVPVSETSSPFSFTYIPDNTDAGKVVTITVITDNPRGSPCRPASAVYLLNVISSPDPPVIESIVQPTCTSSTGSVSLSGLPSYSNWTVNTSPGDISTDGSGTVATIPNLAPGTYTFTVSVSTGCSSAPSAQAEILEQSGLPSPPLPGAVTAPTCDTSTGSVSMLGLPASGTWTLIRYPGTISTTGNGTTSLVTDLPSGIFNFTVTNASGCVSGLSGNVVIPVQPPKPATPVIGIIVQPTIAIPTGSVTLTGLPPAETWTIITTPGDIESTGSGNTFTIHGLEVGVYTFRVKNLVGCSSSESDPAAISVPDKPVIIITDPLPVCYPSTADLTASGITTGSTEGLTYTYWTDNQATVLLEAPDNTPEGIYYIKGTTEGGFFDIKAVKVTVKTTPAANAGHDQVLGFQFNTILDASLEDGESGTWFSESDIVVFSDATNPLTGVSNLSNGNNLLFWIVTNNICPADTDKISITVGELVIPTLITPNGDTENEFFVINGIETMGKTELTVFDKTGIEIYRNRDYDNKWNGVDYNHKPLMNDTYFFILKSSKGKSYNGYIVIRR